LNFKGIKNRSTAMPQGLVKIVLNLFSVVQTKGANQMGTGITKLVDCWYEQTDTKKFL